MRTRRAYRPGPPDRTHYRRGCGDRCARDDVDWRGPRRTPERVDAWVQPHLARRREGVKHPVQDFLFTYYSQRPAALRRWHPGWGVALADARGVRRPERATSTAAARWSSRSERQRASRNHLASPAPPLLDSSHRLLPPPRAARRSSGCFGLHEWAMVHRSRRRRSATTWPLRLGGARHRRGRGVAPDRAAPTSTRSGSSPTRPTAEHPAARSRRPAGSSSSRAACTRGWTSTSTRSG